MANPLARHPLLITGTGILSTVCTVYQFGGWAVRSMVGSLTQNTIGGVQEGLGGAAGETSEKIKELLEQLGTELGKGAEGMDFSGSTETLGEKFSEGTTGFFDGMNLGDLFKDIGKNVREGINGFSGETAAGLGEASRTFLWEVGVKNLPYTVGITALGTGSYLGFYYLYYKMKHNIGRPQLATEVNQLTSLTPLTSAIGRIRSAIFGSNEPKPIYNDDLTRKISQITQSVNNIRSNGGYFQNVLFYGPGGTGKTMISEHIAKNSSMSYIKMSGGDLAQYIKRGEHVTELNKLMDKVTGSWRPWSARPWILFIDEAESLCRDRSKIPSSELLELQNALLNRTGTQSKRVMIMLATNRMEDLDEAILSRMDHKIHIGPPETAERAKILALYIPQFFTKKEQTYFFSESKIALIAKNTEGLTGRALFKMLNALTNQKACVQNNTLTQAMIDEVVRDFVEQEKEVERRGAEKETRQPVTGESFRSQHRRTAGSS